MNCPICDGKTFVTKTYLTTKKTRWRRRECVECLTLFSTYEEVSLKSIPEHLKERMKNE